MIYCIGNSHANTFTGTHPGIQRIWNKKGDFASISLGAVIAYNFMTSHIEKVVDALSKSGIDKKKDFVLLAVGEVDCRVHIPWQVMKQNRSYQELTKECVERYFNAYIYLKENGYNVLGYGSHPSTSQQANNRYGSDMPIIGSPELRNNISICWNNHIEELCKNSSIPFLSVIENFLDKNGKTNMTNFIDYCHLNPDSLIPVVKRKIKELGL